MIPEYPKELFLSVICLQHSVGICQRMPFVNFQISRWCCCPPLCIWNRGILQLSKQSLTHHFSVQSALNLSFSRSFEWLFDFFDLLARLAIHSLTRIVSVNYLGIIIDKNWKRSIHVFCCIKKLRRPLFHTTELQDFQFKQTTNGFPPVPPLFVCHFFWLIELISQKPLLNSVSYQWRTFLINERTIH